MTIVLISVLTPSCCFWMLMHLYWIKYHNSWKLILVFSSHQCSVHLFFILLSVSPTYWMCIWHKIFWWFFPFFSSSSKLVLSRSTSDALLASRISLPRIGNFQCDHCGHRNYGSTVISSYDSYDSYYDHFNIGGLCNTRPMTRPHSVYTDQCNYVKFSFRVSAFFQFCGLFYLYVLH